MPILKITFHIGGIKIWQDEKEQKNVDMVGRNQERASVSLDQNADVNQHTS